MCMCVWSVTSCHRTALRFHQTRDIIMCFVVCSGLLFGHIIRLLWPVQQCKMKRFSVGSSIMLCTLFCRFVGYLRFVLSVYYNALRLKRFNTSIFTVTGLALSYTLSHTILHFTTKFYLTLLPI